MGKTKAELLAEKLSHLHKKRIRAVRRDVTYPFFSGEQQDMLAGFDGFYVDKAPANGVRGRIGLYAELVWSRVLGGQLRKNYIYDVENPFLNHTSDPYLSQPDIMNVKKRQLVESKANVSGSDLKLRDEQIRRYELIQLDPQQKGDLWNINFLLSRHGIKNVEGKFKNLTTSQQLEILAENFFYAIFIPFSLTHDMHKYLPEKDLAYRWDPSEEDIASGRYKRVFEPMTRLKAPTVDLLFEHPEEVIREARRDPKNYAIERKLFPGSMKVNGIKIKPFPVLVIKDNDLNAWIRELRESHTQEIGEYLREIEEETLWRTAREAEIEAERQRAEEAGEDYEDPDALPF